MKKKQHEENRNKAAIHWCRTDAFDVKSNRMNLMKSFLVATEPIFSHKLTILMRKLSTMKSNRKCANSFQQMQSERIEWKTV